MAGLRGVRGVFVVLSVMTDRDKSADVPVACALTASDARERVDRWRKLARYARVASGSRGDSIVAEFRNERDVRSELDVLVAAERDAAAS